MIVEDAFNRINTVLNMQPLEQSGIPEHPKDASIELRDVTYSYDGENNALEDVSLKIQAGQTIALVGPSGGGKTTLANIVSRFFDPQKGSVIIGGVDVRSIEKEELMRHISFVFQNSRLIKDSILNNVRMGKPDAGRQEVMEALKAAQCMDIIDKFPDGVDTVIGTDGVFLSGGEQQRLAIARALLKDSPIIILDEASAFADPDNEYKVQQAFSKLAQDRTVLMIAHRLSTVVNADCIYVLKDGRVIQQGTHDELTKEQGLYGDMWHSYQTSIDWKIKKEA